MADKAQPQGFSARRKVVEPEGLYARRKVTEDDVEGHRFTHARDGFASKRKVVEPEGHSRRKATEDTDTEGHSMLLNPMVARELAKARERDVQKDLKDHRFEREARAAKKDHR